MCNDSYVDYASCKKLFSVYCNKFMYYPYVYLNYFFIYILTLSHLLCVQFAVSVLQTLVDKAVCFCAIFLLLFSSDRYCFARRYAVGLSVVCPCVQKSLYTMFGQVCLLCLALQIFFFCKWNHFATKLVLCHVGLRMSTYARCNFRVALKSKPLLNFY